MLTRCRRALVLGLVLALSGFVLASPAVGREATVVLTAGNPGIGALKLTATVSESTYDGVVIFELDGHEPVEVEMRQYLVVGDGYVTEIDSLNGVRFNQAVVDFADLDPTGSYHASATFVPAGSKPAGGTRAEVTTTLTVTTTPLLFSARKGDGFAYFQIGVIAYPPGKAFGRLVIEDLTTGTTVARIAGIRSRVDDNHLVGGSYRPTRGKHQFRATFTPNAAFSDSQTGAVATTRKIRFPG